MAHEEMTLQDIIADIHALYIGPSRGRCEIHADSEMR